MHWILYSCAWILMNINLITEVLNAYLMFKLEKLFFVTNNKAVDTVYDAKKSTSNDIPSII